MSHIELEPSIANRKSPMAEGVMAPLLTPYVMHLEPEAIAGPGLDRKKKGLPSVFFFFF